MSQLLILEALNLHRAGNFKPGTELEKVHQIRQNTKVKRCWTGLMHWYRRAGKTRHSGSIEEEWHIIRSAVGSA